jgi:hypothetical protein
MMNHDVKVLFATSSPSESITLQILKEAFDVVPVTSRSEAHEKLAEPFDIIVCGSLFDESRMFDLLRYCKAMPHTRNIPFVCIKGRGGKLDDLAYEGVAIALKALNADGFVDFNRWTSQYGAEGASEKLRNLIGGLARNRRGSGP